LFLSLDIISVTKSRKVRRRGRLVLVGKKEDVFCSLAEKLEEKQSFGFLRLWIEEMWK